MNDLRDFLETLISAPTAETLWDIHCAKMSEYGFDRIIYGLSHSLSETSLGDPNDFLILTNHEPKYMKQFMDSGLYQHAPMIRWGLTNVGACSWGHLWHDKPLGELTEKEQLVIDVNIKNGVCAGYSISFKAITSRSRGAVSLAARADMTQADADAVWAEHGRDIALMNNIAHMKLISMPLGESALTSRQREALEWVGDGKTTQDIALLMGLTAATVEKHLSLARKTLNVETTAQAVLKAAFQNQMFIVNAT